MMRGQPPRAPGGVFRRPWWRSHWCSRFRMFVPALVPASSRTAARIEWSFRYRMTCKPAAIVSVHPISGKECPPMALIKPRSRGKRLVRHRTRLDHETNETLYAYARFIGESTE